MIFPKEEGVNGFYGELLGLFPLRSIANFFVSFAMRPSATIRKSSPTEPQSKAKKYRLITLNGAGAAGEAHSFGRPHRVSALKNWN